MSRQFDDNTRLPLQEKVTGGYSGMLLKLTVNGDPVEGKMGRTPFRLLRIIANVCVLLFLGRLG
jgi:hypothetical protein